MSVPSGRFVAADRFPAVGGAPVAVRTLHRDRTGRTAVLELIALMVAAFGFFALHADGVSSAWMYPPSSKSRFMTETTASKSSPAAMTAALRLDEKAEEAPPRH